MSDDIRYRPVTSIDCQVCGQPAIRVTTWPDGTYTATCEHHLDHPTQTALWTGEPQ